MKTMIPPKEEAEELVIAMINVKQFLGTLGQYEAVQCALVAANKLLKYAKAHGFIELSEHYIEVIDELKKLEES